MGLCPLSPIGQKEVEGENETSPNPSRALPFPLRCGAVGAWHAMPRMGMGQVP